MTRHFLGLYLLIVLTLAAVSWGQDRLVQWYGRTDPSGDTTVRLAADAVAGHLHEIPADQWQAYVDSLGQRTGNAIELFERRDITGAETLARLQAGQAAHMVGSGGDTWTLAQLDDGHVVAIRPRVPEPGRGPLDWALTFVFYALIALVLMIWIWPLTRDLRVLERAAGKFGDRNWAFDADIRPHSQIYPLAQAFRRMASRIDGLIASHKDMSNAVSHEIKTPLARMQFEIELAQQAPDLAAARESVRNIKADIAEINDLVTATMEYAILERADLQLRLEAEDFTALVPAVVAEVARDAPASLQINTTVDAGATRVVCDAHLIESALKNLVYNATRYARQAIEVSFVTSDGMHRLCVADDGPGIPAADRERVFDSFVQLGEPGSRKRGFGLGLAIVRRALEWHGGSVAVSESRLGGARFDAAWPVANARAE